MKKYKNVLMGCFFFLICIVINRGIFFWSWIPSGSMEPTITTGSLVLGNKINTDEIQRGDIIIFRYPDDESQYYIKRVIGVPGDVISIQNGKVYLNNIELEEPYAYGETNGDGLYRVPDGSYFVLGDNRENSHDSRYWNHTYVNTEEIAATALVNVWPITEFKIF